jgi:hypothetical protein
VENHGGESRQINVGLRLHTTGLARLVVLGIAFVATLAASSGVLSAALLLGGATLGAAEWLRRQMRDLSRSIHHGVTVAFAHLPVALLDEADAGEEQALE